MPAGKPLTKITARAADGTVEGLARLLAYGEKPLELQGYEISLTSVTCEPAIGRSTDSGLLIVRGIEIARIALKYDYRTSDMPMIDAVMIAAQCELSTTIGGERFVDMDAPVKMHAGNPGGKATYYVISATCDFKPND